MRTFETSDELTRLAVEKCGSAAALARYLEVTPESISSWKLGKRRPGYEPTRRMLRLVYGGEEG